MWEEFCDIYSPAKEEEGERWELEEHGGGIRGSWLTKYGEKIIRRFKCFVRWGIMEDIRLIKTDILQSLRRNLYE